MLFLCKIHTTPLGRLYHFQDILYRYNTQDMEILINHENLMQCSQHDDSMRKEETHSYPQIIILKVALIGVKTCSDLYFEEFRSTTSMFIKSFRRDVYLTIEKLLMILLSPWRYLRMLIYIYIYIAIIIN